MTVLSRRGVLAASGLLIPWFGAQAPAQAQTRGASIVATRSKIANNFAVARRSMSRTYHYARDGVADLQVVFANWYGAPGKEIATGGKATVRAAIEYPEGTCTPLRFSGGPAGGIADGAMLASDVARVSIPKDAKFFVRTFFEHPSKVIFAGRQDRANGDAWAQGFDGVTDQTMGGAIVSSNDSTAYFPVAILAPTRARSVCIIGDSRAREEGDRIDDGAGDQGNIARSIGPAFGYVNCALAGESFKTFLAANKQRRILAGYATHIVSDLGINDLTGNVPAAKLRSQLSDVVGLFPGKPVFWTTAEPVTASRDRWATVAGQTPHKSNDQRIAWNTWLRSRPRELAGVFDLADAAESARDSGRFKAPDQGAFPVMTEDGTHLTMAGYLLEKNSGAIDVRLIR